MTLVELREQIQHDIITRCEENSTVTDDLVDDLCQIVVDNFFKFNGSVRDQIQQGTFRK